MTYYFDSDGVLARWNTQASFEEVLSKGYYLHCEPEPVMIVTIKYMFLKGEDVRILTAYPNEHSLYDKDRWFDLYGLKGVPRIYVPYGDRKGDYVKEEGSILIDDFTRNLNEWRGIPVKFYNGINGTKGTYRGYAISHRMNASQIVAVLRGIAAFHEAA